MAPTKITPASAPIAIIVMLIGSTGGGAGLLGGASHDDVGSAAANTAN